MNDKHIDVNCTLDANEQDIKERYRQNCPTALGLNKLLDRFPEHRWTGAEEVLRQISVFSGTHGLFEPVMCNWLNITMEVPRPTGLAAIGYAEFSSEEEEDNDLEAGGEASDNDNGPSNDTAKKSAEIHSKQKTKTIRLVRSRCRGIAIITCLIHRALDILMRHKLFIAGKRWDCVQNEASVEGHPRSYRITDEASNIAETKFAWATAKLFCNPVEWNCLHLNDRNMRQRANAFRLISRQVSMVFLLLFIPHLVGPFSLFRDLDGNDDSFDLALGQPSCFYGDFMYHHMKAFPSAADLLGKTSMFILLCIADLARTQSTRSENGHAFWQREARLRSVQTACADYDDISAIVFLHQCRLAELTDEITSAPATKGRKKKPNKESLENKEE